MVAAGCQGAPPPRFEGAEAPDSETPVVHENVLINLWGENKTSFGVYVPNEDPPPADGQGRGAGGERPAPVYTVEGGRKLAENPLYDFVFLNIEGNYDVEAVRAIGEGIRSPTAVGRKTFLVRIPTIERDGAELTKARVKEVLDLGADGVVIPHIRGTEEARLALSFFTDAGADVWSPSNRWGEVIAMLMLEDPGAIAQATEVADIEGISVLACGIGSLTGAIAAQMREGIDGEMSEELLKKLQATAPLEGVANLFSGLNILFALALTVFGMNLLQEHPKARTRLFVWSVLYILLTIAGIIINWTPRLPLIQENSEVQGMFLAQLLISMPMYLILPIFLLIFLNRKQVRSEIASWR